MSWIVIVLGYLLGSVPTAYIAGHLTRGLDIRRVGDLNAGAANAFHELGAGVGITVGIIDAAKGTLAVLIARSFNVPQPVVLMAGAAAVMGHNWPVFTGFRGGRGVSTTIGVLFALVTTSMLIMTMPSVLTLLLTRDTTKASAVLFILLPFVGWALGVSFALIAYGIALPILVALTHYFRVRHMLRQT